MARRSPSGNRSPLCIIAMTSEEAVNKLECLGADQDQEDAHIEADSILIQFLTGQGFSAVADAYLKAKHDIGFEYACPTIS